MAITFHLVKKLLLTVSVVVVCMAPISAIATSPGRVPPEKTRWFSIKNAEINVPQNLPTNKFKARISDSSTHIEFKHKGSNPIYLQIENASDNDGYLVGYDDNDRGEYNNNPSIPNILEFPFVPIYKLVNGKVYKYEHLYPGAGHYNLIETENNWLQIHMEDINSDLQDLWKKGDGRPEDVEIPEPITFNYQILYSTHHDNQFYDVTGEVSFSLNENYQATAKQDAIDAAGRAHMDMLRDDMVLPNALIIIVEFFIVLTIVIFSWLPFV